MPTKSKSHETIQPRSTDPVTVAVRQRGSTSDMLYRFISTLDADVHVSLEGTGTIDGDSFADAETISIGGETGDPDADTKLITAGNSTKQVESVELTDGWPWLQFTVTPQTTPTTGSLELRDIKNF